MNQYQSITRRDKWQYVAAVAAVSLLVAGSLHARTGNVRLVAELYLSEAVLVALFFALIAFGVVKGWLK